AANEAAGALIGCNPDELIGSSYTAFWPESIPSPLDLSLDLQRSHKAQLKQRNGRVVSVNLTVFPLDAGANGQTIVTITNLDTVQHLNNALSHTQRLAGVGILTAGVAHELVTPISIITNTCGNVRAQLEDDALSTTDLMRYLEMVEQSIWRCMRIVGVLRDYTFDDLQHMAVTEMNAIIDDAMVLLRHQFRSEFRIEFDLDLSDSPKSLVCDHNQMTQVLINLLINARDAMQPDGGTIQIKTWTIPTENPSPSLASPAITNGKTAVESYAFSVRDSGCGIKPAIMDKIFDPFFTTKPNGKGTGLGLFLARQIVHQHNGRIWAENNSDGGATFTVVLPRHQ
ncbi:MAG: ATP-binding protein, partial [Anaerolineae bacterium]